MRGLFLRASIRLSCLSWPLPGSPSTGPLLLVRVDPWQALGLRLLLPADRSRLLLRLGGRFFARRPSRGPTCYAISFLRRLGRIAVGLVRLWNRAPPRRLCARALCFSVGPAGTEPG